jgi:hypothetical protein
MIAKLGLSCASTKEIVAVRDLFVLRQNIFWKSKKAHASWRCGILNRNPCYVPEPAGAGHIE